MNRVLSAHQQREMHLMSHTGYWRLSVQNFLQERNLRAMIWKYYWKKKEKKLKELDKPENG